MLLISVIHWLCVFWVCDWLSAHTLLYCCIVFIKINGSTQSGLHSVNNDKGSLSLVQINKYFPHRIVKICRS